MRVSATPSQGSASPCHAKAASWEAHSLLEPLGIHDLLSSASNSSTSQAFSLTRVLPCDRMPFREISPANRTRRSLFSSPSGHHRLLCVVIIQALKARLHVHVTSVHWTKTLLHPPVLTAGLLVLPSHHPAGNWPTKTQLSGGTGTSSILFPTVTPNRKASRNGLRWKERNLLSHHTPDATAPQAINSTAYKYAYTPVCSPPQILFIRGL